LTLKAIYILLSIRVIVGLHVLDRAVLAHDRNEVDGFVGHNFRSTV
jgi:hypothetical protein